MIEVLGLQRELLTRITPTGLDSRPRLNEQIDTSSQSPFVFACTFYGLEKPSLDSPQQRSDIPFVTASEDLIRVSLHAAKGLLQRGENQAMIREMLIEALSLLVTLIGSLDESQQKTFTVDWNPTEWSSVMMQCLSDEVYLHSIFHIIAIYGVRQTTTFAIVDSVVATMLKLHQTRLIHPAISLDDRQIMDSIINTVRYRFCMFARFLFMIIIIVVAVPSTSMCCLSHESRHTCVVSGTCQHQSTY